MDLTAFHSQFRDELTENIRILTEGLLAYEVAAAGTSERREQLDAIFRAMHTIKGSARLLGFEDIGRIAHTCEYILGAVRDGRRELDQLLADDLLRGGDAMVELIAAALDGRSAAVDVEALSLTLGRGVRKELPEGGATPALLSLQTDVEVPVAPRPARSSARPTIRVRVDRLDRLLNLAGELTVGRQSQALHLQKLVELQALLGQHERLLLALEAELKQLRFSAVQRELLDRHLNGLLNTGEHAGRLLRSQVERFDHHVANTAALIEDLEGEVMAVRLLPISTLFTHLPRAVRELARDLDKQVELVVSGENTELDRKMIEALNDPLLHIVRNAVDHGIEPADVREALGKPPGGTIEVSARARGAYAQITIGDDGRGMEPQLLREVAVRKGLLPPDAAAALSDQEALELIFMPGFTTAQMITDISGRGVGMDVVRTNIQELGGQVQLESRAGAGTTITLVLPLTLVTTRVLLIEVGRYVFALPASSCQGSAWARPGELHSVEGHAMLPYEGRLAPLLLLADLLGIAGPHSFPSYQRMPAVLLGSTQRPLALLVDRLIDEREVVVKPLGALLERQRRFSGAIQLGDGSLVLLLNPLVLAQAAQGMALANLPARAAAAAAATRRSRLLVADDSFTTRELIRSILHSAGYEVTTAVDGRDALDKLRAAPYDLVVSDVEMPRVDGFQLTSQIRQDPVLVDLPVVIVTSLASEAHRQRGLAVGAQAYIVKSQFDQGSLLDTVRQLLGA
jgi:two-component system chemotaxis sensor kinase CheA